VSLTMVIGELSIMDHAEMSQAQTTDQTTLFAPQWISANLSRTPPPEATLQGAVSRWPRMRRCGRLVQESLVRFVRAEQRHQIRNTEEFGAFLNGVCRT